MITILGDAFVNLSLHQEISGLCRDWAILRKKSGEKKALCSERGGGFRENPHEEGGAECLADVLGITPGEGRGYGTRGSGGPKKIPGCDSVYSMLCLVGIIMTSDYRIHGLQQTRDEECFARDLGP